MGIRQAKVDISANAADADQTRAAKQGYIRNTTYMFIALLVLTAVMLIALEFIAGDLNF
jgi:hypothetical protein